MASSAAKKVVVITGANTGIGYEAVKALLQSSQPYHIFLGSRSADKGSAAAERLRAEVPETPSSVEVLEVDITSDASIAAAFGEVETSGLGRVDVLLNNAGHHIDLKIGKELSVRDTWNQTYDVNVSGTHVMTHAFAPLLAKSADPRLIFLTSGLASCQNMREGYYPGPAPSARGWPKPAEGAGAGASPAGSQPLASAAYRASKTALNMMMLSWHWELAPDGVKVWSVSPGFLATGLGGGTADMLRARGAGDASIGGALLRDVIEGRRDADVGRVVSSRGVQPF